ncbi:PIN domain-containing protein [Cloacibacillus evryensis]|uniref:PIN domain-containing protein n=1 Tax=Cloacibacillus evryensis TaxID=508460 RepID=UPI003A88AA4D
MATFVDANVFIRFFANDDKIQSEAAEKLFQKARSRAAELLTGPPVFFEIAWVLGYRYKIKSEEIMDILESIVGWPGISVLDETLVLKAIALARETKSEFADAYIAASAGNAGANDIATFNKKHFIRLKQELCQEI